MGSTYLENRILELLSEMGSSFSSLHHRYELEDYRGPKELDDEEKEGIYLTETSFHTNAKSIFRLITNYLESKKQLNYLQEFQKTIKPYLEKAKTSLEGELNEFDGTVHSKLIDEISDFLNAYEFFGEKGYEFLIKRAGIIYLENILENTAVTINALNKIPTSETQVYDAVKFVCHATFPKANFPTSKFITIAKEYIPDILIPHLNCAVEYKYATTESKLKDVIDQILIDVKGYSNHSTYKLFYAVFYVKPDIWGRKKFEAVWKEKGFPKNWKGIYVVG